MNLIKKCLKSNIWLLIILTIFFLSFSFSYANMVWPGAYIPMGLIKYYIIIINFITTYVTLRLLLKYVPKLEILALSVGFMLLISLAGIIVIPICGLIGELIFSFLNIPTFSIASWSIEVITAVLFYVLVEGSIIKLAFKQKFKKTVLPLFLYNLIVIGFGIIEILLISPESMRF